MYHNHTESQNTQLHKILVSKYVNDNNNNNNNNTGVYRREWWEMLSEAPGAALNN